MSITQLVECQIVALEVSGSNPGIYLYMWNLEKKLLPKILSSKVTWTLYFLMSFRWGKYLNTNFNFLLSKYYLLINSTTLSSYNLKSLCYSVFKPSIFFKQDKLPTSNFIKKKPWKKVLVTSFINLNTWLPTPTLKVHHSFTALYYFNKQSNIGIFNLKRLFTVWNNILFFMQSIVSFNLKYTFFSSSYFRYENLSLNWYKNKHLKSLWKFTDPFIFFLNNKTTLSNDIYFKFLKRKLSNLSFVVDIYYHKRTLHYLKKYKYITIGPVPISSNLYSLTISFPTSSNSVFSNLFFIRFLFRLKKLTSYENFQSYKHLN